MEGARAATCPPIRGRPRGSTVPPSPGPSGPSRSGGSAETSGRERVFQLQGGAMRGKIWCSVVKYDTMIKLADL